MVVRSTDASPTPLAENGLARPSTVPALIVALDDPDAYVREKAAEALARVNPPVGDCLPALVDLLRDRDFNIRQSAGLALERVGLRAGEVAPALRALLKDRDPFVRVLAARVLGDVSTATTRRTP